MEVTGTIFAILEKKSGISQNTGNQWQRQEFVIDHPSGSYSKKIAMTISGEAVDRFADVLQVGQKVKVSYDINTREWQGRWFNEISAWNIQADFTETNKAVTTEHVAAEEDPFAPENANKPL